MGWILPSSRTFLSSSCRTMSSKLAGLADDFAPCSVPSIVSSCSRSFCIRELRSPSQNTQSNRDVTSSVSRTISSSIITDTDWVVFWRPTRHMIGHVRNAFPATISWLVLIKTKLWKQQKQWQTKTRTSSGIWSPLCGEGGQLGLRHNFVTDRQKCDYLSHASQHARCTTKNWANTKINLLQMKQPHTNH